MYHDHYWWNMPMMWIIWIPILIICIVLLVKLLDKTETGKGKNAEKESPLDILKRRYANGELTTDEYEKRKKILEGN